MKIGFLTNSLVSEGLRDIEAMAAWAVRNGFENLEVGPKLPLNESAFKKVMNKGEIIISALTYCRNFLSEDEQEARTHRSELLYRIETAGRLGIPVVVTSTGISSKLGAGRIDGYEAIRSKPIQSLEAVVDWLSEVIQTADKAGVKVALENCPLMGNMAISPDLWKKLFNEINHPALGIAYDPSHLTWQMIDPYIPLKEFADRIFHIHAKDTEIQEEVLRRTGILTDFSWWRYRLPGLGQLNWTRFISILHEIGYKGSLSIEHEDPVWSGSIDLTKQGLLLSKDFLEQIPGFYYGKKGQIG
jgi:sugar phosphate isomerase/epimerase